MISEETIIMYSNNHEEIKNALDILRAKLISYEVDKKYNKSMEEYIEYTYIQRLILQGEKADKKSFKAHY